MTSDSNNERRADSSEFVFENTTSIESPKDFFSRVSDQLSSRRSFMNHAAKIGGGALALSAGTGTALADHHNDDDSGGKAKEGGNGKSKAGGGMGGNGGSGGGGMGGGQCQRGGPSDVEVLNYALLLERLEATFYTEGVDTFSEDEIEHSASAQQFAGGDLQYGAYQKFEQIRDQEQTHVETLAGAIEEIGGDPVGNPGFTFPYETVPEFIGLAQVFEDTGTAAYLGAAPFISSAEYLGVAAQITAVEARHASYLRSFSTASLTPFPNAFNETMTMSEVQEAVEPFIDG